MKKNSNYISSDIYGLIEPYFTKIYEKLGKRNPPATERTRKFASLCKKICGFFEGIKSYKELDNPRLWREFHKHASNSLSLDSQRIFTQDLNRILGMLCKDGKIGKIKLKPPIRKFSSSEGFHVEKLLDFTYRDIVKLWHAIRNVDNEEFSLLFMLVICSGIPVNHLICLKVDGIKLDSVEIRHRGLICSVLLEPGRTLLLNYIVQKGIKKSDNIFGHINQAAFTRWLRKQCKRALVPEIDAKKLFYFARFLMVLQGALAYQVSCLGSKNAFSPLSEIINRKDVTNEF
ncbi:hypothetical protein AUJ64_03585 [Candidatus Pacearchaeota archaeon CG1_02_39_14]|nr:MAG: hypothetical protein AUJ64_03585 [Candidatus Pacearchaeota archaeon CG1_02_39_14]